MVWPHNVSWLVQSIYWTHLKMAKYRQVGNSEKWRSICWSNLKTWFDQDRFRVCLKPDRLEGLTAKSNQKLKAIPLNIIADCYWRFEPQISFFDSIKSEVESKSRQPAGRFFAFITYQISIFTFQFCKIVDVAELRTSCTISEIPGAERAQNVGQGNLTNP
jgi:hypothetical protein